MNLDQLPYILEIASCKNLSAAAQNLSVSQPALSKYLSNLENEIGMELFWRHKKKLYPTSAGFIYIRMARRILEIQSRTLNSMAQLHTMPNETLFVGASPHRGTEDIAAIYPAFLQKFPQVKLSVREGYTSQLRDYLRNQQVSLVIGTSLKEDENDFLFIPIVKEELLLTVPSYHRMASRASKDPEFPALADLKSFQDSPFILMEPDSSVGEASEALFSQVQFFPRVVHRFSNVTMVCHLIRSGLGIGLLQKHYAMQYPDLCYFRISPIPQTTLGVLWRPMHSLRLSERYLIYKLMEKVSSDALYQIEWSPVAEQIWNEFKEESQEELL